MKTTRVASMWTVAACMAAALWMVSSSMAATPAASPAQKKETGPAAARVVAKRCPDLSADRIEFSIVSKTGKFKGKVKIVGVIRNVGTRNYKSSPNQQTIMLYQGGTLVSSKAFQNLAVNGEEKIEYTREWDAGSPAEGEFPPEYKLAIIFDPDIMMDNNTDNDDCNAGNNHKSRSGSDINALLRP